MSDKDTNEILDIASTMEVISSQGSKYELTNMISKLQGIITRKDLEQKDLDKERLSLVDKKMQLEEDIYYLESLQIHIEDKIKEINEDISII